MKKHQRIAIISDIHGNMTALKSVIEDINDRGVDQTICLGDVVGKGPHSAEALDLCLKFCHLIVKGNWDDFLSNKETVLTEFISYYRQQLGEERLKILRNLPEVTGFWLSGRYVRLFHANPHSLYDRVYGDSLIEKRMSLFEFPRLQSTEDYSGRTDIVGYGDIHGAYLQHLDGQRVLFNAGSVGNSCDSIAMASYIILEGVLNSQQEDDFSVQFYRVKYDRDLAIQSALESDLIDKELYIKEIETGLYCR